MVVIPLSKSCYFELITRLRKFLMNLGSWYKIRIDGVSISNPDRAYVIYYDYDGYGYYTTRGMILYYPSFKEANAALDSILKPSSDEVMKPPKQEYKGDTFPSLKKSDYKIVRVV